MQSYSFIIIKYVHDILSEEFVNIGIFLYTHDTNEILFKYKKQFGRISNFFHGINTKNYKLLIKTLNSSVQFITKKIKQEPLFNQNHKNAEQILFEIWNKDDSSIQWSSLKCGISEDINKTLNELYNRYVTYYDKENKNERRTDLEIWKSFNSNISQEIAHIPFEKVEIETSIEKKIFDYSLKENNITYCFDPISFDLTTDEGIIEKARKLVGSCWDFHELPNNFKLILLLGEPSIDHKNKYKTAVDYLEKFISSLKQNSCTIISESKKDIFTEMINSILK